MSTMTVARLMEIMQACAGGGEGVDPTSDLQDTTFTDLGYDSLALLETASRIERECGVRLADGEVTEARTPRELLCLINGAAAV
jgi:minimal PKS acyl carrier protein